jgi:hypothetical protein
MKMAITYFPFEGLKNILHKIEIFGLATLVTNLAELSKVSAPPYFFFCWLVKMAKKVTKSAIGCKSMFRLSESGNADLIENVDPEL